ncbi:hypothetical protein ABZX33_04140 [Streptomyces sp. NPDC004608]|uniref:hypothetical protein n=1 Tax=unclassified Streptomyces TaxID=2593676 RepID=UPI0033ACF630
MCRGGGHRLRLPLLRLHPRRESVPPCAGLRGAAPARAAHAAARPGGRRGHRRVERARPPAWELPSVLTPAHSAPRYTAFELSTHPQEICENTVDVRHLAPLHHFINPSLRDPVADKHVFSHWLCAGRRYPPFGTRMTDVRITLHGLGFFNVNVQIPGLGLTLDAMFYPTPVDPWRVRMYLASSVAFTPPAGKLPPRMLLQLSQAANLLNHRTLANDAARDFFIWDSKRYTEPPSLAKGDGPIGTFRKWAKQFY